MKKKILSILGNNKIITGAHKRYLYLLEELANKGNQINFVNGLESKIFNKNINYIDIKSPSKNKIPLPFNIILLLSIIYNFKKIKKYKCDVVIIFGETNFLTGLFLKKIFKIPLIFGARSNILEYRKIDIFSSGINYGFIKTKNIFLLNIYIYLFSLFEKFIIKNSDKIIVQNNHDLNEMKKRSKVNNNRFYIIKNNINVPWINTNIKNNSNKLNKIVFLGSIDERKGIRYLIESLNKLKYKNKIEYYLDIIGDGYLKDQIQELINKYNLEKVKILGYIDNPYNLLAYSDLLIVPSLADSFPNIILEALSLGTPVIGSRVGGIIEILREDKLLFKSKNSDEIYNKLLLLRNKENYYEIKKLCKIRKNRFIFDWASKFENVIQNM